MNDDPASRASKEETLYACSCAEVYGSHPPDCPARQQFERLTREVAVQKGVNDLAYIPHRALVESRDGLQKRYDKVEAERERLRDRLLNRVNLCACHYATSNRPSDCATCKQDREILSEATDSSVETTVSLSPEDEKRIGESERELAVLKKDGRSYKTRRVAGQALEAITLLKAKTASPLDWMECPVTKEPCNCHGFCKRMAESSEKA